MEKEPQSRIWKWMVDIGELMENLTPSFNVQFLQLVRDHLPTLPLMEIIYAEVVMMDRIVQCVRMDISRSTMDCVSNVQPLLLPILMC